MENCGNLERRAFAGCEPHEGRRKPHVLRACSACAGDYEDPDRTAWTAEDSGEDEGETMSQPAEKEFPEVT